VSEDPQAGERWRWTTSSGNMLLGESEDKKIIAVKNGWVQFKALGGNTNIAEDLPICQFKSNHTKYIDHFKP
jgi:hypothetical protein